MIDRTKLVVGQVYEVVANDMITEWTVQLEWLGDGWSHPTQNIDGYYPCIVAELLQEKL